MHAPPSRGRRPCVGVRLRSAAEKRGGRHLQRPARAPAWQRGGPVDCSSRGFPALLQRGESAPRAQRWPAWSTAFGFDTRIPTRSFLLIAVVRHRVGWAQPDRNDHRRGHFLPRCGSMRCLAVDGRPEIFKHPPGSSQFTSASFSRSLSDNAIRISMDGRGSWRDNVLVQRLWRSVKYGKSSLLRAYDSVSEARSSIGVQSPGFYNPKRGSSLDGRTPASLRPIRWPRSGGGGLNCCCCRALFRVRATPAVPDLSTVSSPTLSSHLRTTRRHLHYGKFKPGNERISCNVRRAPGIMPPAGLHRRQSWRARPAGPLLLDGATLAERQREWWSFAPVARSIARRHFSRAGT